MNLRLAHADTIIFLDLPTVTCLLAIVKRYLKYRGTNRPDMTEGNRERITSEFLFYVLFFRIRSRPAIMRRLESLPNTKSIIHLKSRAEVSKFLKGIAK